MDKNFSITLPFRVLGILALLLFVGQHSLIAQDSTEVTVDALKQQQKAVTLTQAINVALANNTDIKRALLSVKTADEQVRIAWSEVMPEVNANASYTRNVEVPVNIIPANRLNPSLPSDSLVAFSLGQDNNWNGGVSINQTLFRGEAIIGIGASELFKAAQSENLRATSQQIVTQTRIAYYNVLVAEEQYRLQKLTVDRLEENLKENRARKKAGLVDEYAVLQVEVQLSNQQPQLTQAKYGVQKAYRELKLTMGLPIALDIGVRGELNSFNIMGGEVADEENGSIKEIDQMTPYSYNQGKSLMDVAVDSRGDIRVLKTQEDLKEREIKAIKSRFLPTLSASYNLNWSAAQAGNPVFFGNELTRSRSQAIGVTLSLPIFQGFQRSANLQIAQIEEKDIALQQEFAERSARNEIQSAKESLNQAIETSPARMQALEQAREGYNRARARLENGIGSQIDVTEAEFQLRQAEVNYAQTVFNYLSAKARYDLAIGRVPFVDNAKPEIK